MLDIVYTYEYNFNYTFKIKSLTSKTKEIAKRGSADGETVLMFLFLSSFSIIIFILFCVVVKSYNKIVWK